MIFREVNMLTLVLEISGIHFSLIQRRRKYNQKVPVERFCLKIYCKYRYKT